jgi:hypothetical protein
MAAIEVTSRRSAYQHPQRRMSCYAPDLAVANRQQHALPCALPCDDHGSWCAGVFRPSRTSRTWLRTLQRAAPGQRSGGGRYGEWRSRPSHRPASRLAGWPPHLVHAEARISVLGVAGRRRRREPDGQRSRERPAALWSAGKPGPASTHLRSPNVAAVICGSQVDARGGGHAKLAADVTSTGHIDAALSTSHR